MKHYSTVYELEKDGVTKETAENDFCSFAKEVTDHSTEKGDE